MNFLRQGRQGFRKLSSDIQTDRQTDGDGRTESTEIIKN